MVAWKNDIDGAGDASPERGGYLRAAVFFAVVLILATILFASKEESTASAASAISGDSESLWIASEEQANIHFWRQVTGPILAEEWNVPAFKLWEGEPVAQESVPVIGPDSADTSDNGGSSDELKEGDTASEESMSPLHLRTY